MFRRRSCSPLLIGVLFAWGLSATVAPARAGLAPGSLLIYYSWPSAINGTYAVPAAAAEFARYDRVVLGDGLELATHPDHANTAAIVAQVHALASTRVYGYVDLGVSTQNLSPAEIAQRLDAWQATGADGVFLDDFGYDFQVTRERQNAAVAAAHARGLPVVANGWNPADVFGRDVDPVHNPTGAAPLLGAGDFYLSESCQYQAGAYPPAADWHAKAAAVAGYRAQLGFGVLAVTTNDAANAYDPAAFAYAWHSALLWGYDAVGWGEYLFAALTASAPWRERPAVSPGSAFRSSVVATPPLYRRATDLGWISVDTAAHLGAFTPGLGAARGESGPTLALRAAPNPFNPATTLVFTLAAASPVELAVYGLDGRTVAVLADGATYGAGEHAVPFFARGLAGATYFCRLRAGDAEAVCRLTLVR